MQTRLATLTSLAFLIAGCDGGPQHLASALDSALKAGDMDSAQALLDRTSLPFEQSIYLEVVAHCVEEGATCTASTGPITEAIRKDESEQAANRGAEWKPLPEGLIDIAMKTTGMQGARYFLYAKVDGQYRIVAEHYSAAKVAELKAMTGRLPAGRNCCIELRRPRWRGLDQTRLRVSQA